MNIEEIKKYLADNKDDAAVVAFLGELSRPTVDGVKGFLDTEEGKKILQPRLDSNFTKGLETWKANNLETIIQDEINKRSTKTPEQLEIEKLRKQIEDAEKARNRESLVNKALKVAKEKNLPDGILDYFIGEDEDSTNTNLSKLEEVFTKAVQAGVESKFKGSGREINTGDFGKEGVGTNFAKKANDQSKPTEKTIWD